MVRLSSLTSGDLRRPCATALLFGIAALVIIGTASTPALAQRQGFNLGPKDAVTTPHEINLIADAGGDTVRFPCHFWANPDVWYWLNLADAAQQTCERRGMVLVIAFQMSGDVFNTQQGQDNFVWAWQRFAERFSGRSGRLWFELGNEITHPAWRDIALRAAQAIRRVDTRHSIAFSPRGTTTDPAASFTPLPGITHQILTFHYYDWWDVQYGGVPYPSTGRTRDLLRQRLQRVADAGRRHGLAVYISEVAIIRHHQNAPRFLRDFTSICDEMGIHLTLHAFRESWEWDYEVNHEAWAVLTNWLAR
jgi:hypothetical protein